MGISDISDHPPPHCLTHDLRTHNPSTVTVKDSLDARPPATMADPNSPTVFAADGCPVYAPFFGAMGAAMAMIFGAFGAAYGTAKSGAGIAAMGVLRPELAMKAVIPVIMAGIVGIYGLVVGCLIAQGLNGKGQYSLFKGFLDLASGLTTGLSGLAAGFAIGIIGDSGVRGFGQQPKLFVNMVLILIFAEVLGLYGFIVSLLMFSNSNVPTC